MKRASNKNIYSTKETGINKFGYTSYPGGPSATSNQVKAEMSNQVEFGVGSDSVLRALKKSDPKNEYIPLYISSHLKNLDAPHTDDHPALVFVLAKNKTDGKVYTIFAYTSYRHTRDGVFKNSDTLISYKNKVQLNAVQLKAIVDYLVPGNRFTGISYANTALKLLINKLHMLRKI